MELDLRKTAADAAYIAVGAGVLGFQQAQVRRREAGEYLATLAKDAQSTIDTQSTALRNRVTGTAAKVNDTATSGLDSATETIKTLDPRQWVEPVVADVRQRVEPVIEQLKGVSLPTSVQTLPATVQAQVQALPEQITKAVEVGKARVQSLRGSTN